MHPGAVRDDWTWHRILARVRPGFDLEPIRAKLDATSHAFEENRARGFRGMTRETIERFLAQKVVIQPASSGASDLQSEYRDSLGVLAMLVVLVLGIACVNVANLMTGQAAARAREMALRVSIGAGRWRLVQLVLLESAELAAVASLIGALFAWQAAPLVLRLLNPGDNPIRLALPADWRLFGFGVALAAAVTVLFGLAPALQASAITPATALRGGSHPLSRRRSMRTLVAIQVAFSVVVVFLAGLFATTFHRLSVRPLGFSAERVLNLETVSPRPQPRVSWEQVVAHLRDVPGVETAAILGWPMLGGPAWNGFVSVDGAPPGPTLAYYLSVSPGWLDAMKISLVEGRDLRPDDGFPGAALVNETFVREFLGTGRDVGRKFAKGDLNFVVAGVVRDAPYRNLREPILPVAYVAFGQQVQSAAFVVRTRSANPLALASTLRREIPNAHAGLRVSNIRTQTELVQAQTLRERVLALLAMFFGAAALLLSAIGLYGVLDYSVLQQRREIGIRLAIGAPTANIARHVTAGLLLIACAGAIAGLACALASARYVAPLLYHVNPSEPALVLFPLVVNAILALAAALPGAIRAVRIDPVGLLRAE
jgi:predicted permease